MDVLARFCWRAKEQGILRQVAALVITIGTGIHIQGILANGAVTNALAYSLAAKAALAGDVSGALTTGTLNGTLVVALSALTFHQIGVTAGLSDGERIFAHALAGGTLEVLGGGKFGHWFVSAGLGKALSPLADIGHLIRDGCYAVCV